ncbi:MAG: hypothetical protein HOQ13_04510 [Dermatophilaceae bacterium]|nr:hypothetical protein [Dermatophilaceae bacterium]
MGGAPSLPTPSTAGYTSFRGRTACVCLAEWLPVLERLLLAHGVIKQSLDVVQLTGGAPASGGTHTQGGAFDIRQRDAVTVRVVREMGAPAFWPRTGPAWVGNEHAHGVLLGCPHNAPARYQLEAQRRGYDGLGQAKTGPYAGMWGYGGRDPQPGPATYRTWSQGIAWAETELAHLATPAPTPVAPTTEGLSMADINTLTAQLDALTAAVKGLRSEESGRYQVATGRHAWLAGALNNIAGRVGVDVDEQAIADGILTGLAPTVRQAVIDAGQPEAVADAVVAKLGAALTPPA